MFQKAIFLVTLLTLSTCSNNSLRKTNLKSPAPSTNLYSLSLVSHICNQNNLLTALIQQKGSGTLYYTDSQYVASESHLAVIVGNTVAEWDYTIVFKPFAGSAQSNSFQINVYAMGVKGNTMRINNTVSCPK